MFEDERFYIHPGVDPLSAARALIISNVISLKRVSGASTLAMQVCRMLEPKEQTIFSKVREALGAIHITAAYGRDERNLKYVSHLSSIWWQYRKVLLQPAIATSIMGHSI